MHACTSKVRASTWAWGGVEVGGPARDVVASSHTNPHGQRGRRRDIRGKHPTMTTERPMAAAGAARPAQEPLNDRVRERLTSRVRRVDARDAIARLETYVRAHGAPLRVHLGGDDRARAIGSAEVHRGDFAVASEIPEHAPPARGSRRRGWHEYGDYRLVHENLGVLRVAAKEFEVGPRCERVVGGAGGGHARLVTARGA